MALAWPSSAEKLQILDLHLSLDEDIPRPIITMLYKLYLSAFESNWTTSHSYQEQLLRVSQAILK